MLGGRGRTRYRVVRFGAWRVWEAVIIGCFSVRRVWLCRLEEVVWYGLGAIWLCLGLLWRDIRYLVFWGVVRFFMFFRG